jgi:hypothetical protein
MFPYVLGMKIIVKNIIIKYHELRKKCFKKVKSTCAIMRNIFIISNSFNKLHSLLNFHILYCKILLKMR